MILLSLIGFIIYLLIIIIISLKISDYIDDNFGIISYEFIFIICIVILIGITTEVYLLLIN